MTAAKATPGASSPSPTAQTPPKILVVGLTGAGADGLTATVRERIAQANLLIGGRRHLGYFADFSGETLTITANIAAVVDRLRQAQATAEQAVVLGSGDPLCFGIGASLRRHFPADALDIIPALSAFQLAFAVLGEPWTDAALLSAHARPLAEVVRQVMAAPLAAILTDNDHTPAVIAEALLAANIDPASPVAICENLGGPAQRIVRTTLTVVDQENYAALNVFVIWPKNYGPLLITNNQFTIHNSDQAYATSASQITKREVRLISLAELALQPGQVLWDIGAGSGAVSIEAARSQPTARVFAIEKRAEMIAHLEENLRRFPAPNLTWLEGLAPDALGDWPDPDAAFVGGSGGRLAEIIELAQQRLRPGGRLVINLATLENLQTVRQVLPAARVTQAQFSRGVPILEMMRFEALNPVFIVVWRKRGNGGKLKVTRSK